ncbi:MAG: hypothetical protein ACNYPF_02410 [Candidatus Puniceispirillales bacterium WSBS_2018_MAG_OTU23]
MRDNKFFRLNGRNWILYALLAVTIIAGMVYNRDGNIPQWEDCRESMMQQMFSDTCTPRKGLGGGKVITIPASPGQNT